MDSNRPRDYTVLSVGGSLICPNGPDIDYINALSSIITKRASIEKRFITVAGGGDLARTYIHGAAALGENRQEILDTIGIRATWLNAQLLRAGFGTHAANEIITDVAHHQQYDTPVRVAGGTMPGWSTDYVTSQLGAKYHATRIINLTCTDGIYTDDPVKNPHAQRLDELTWNDYRALTPQEWTPGLNTPFDPIAARLCEERGLPVIIIDGRDLSNLEHVLDGAPYVGTTIRCEHIKSAE